MGMTRIKLYADQIPLYVHAHNSKRDFGYQEIRVTDCL